MNLRKKLSLLVLCGVSTITSVGLASCGKSDSLPEFVMPEGGFDTTQNVEITFYHTMNKTLQDVVDACIPAFNKIYPNITVNHQAIGAYDDVIDQLTTSLANGNAQCDLAYCYADHIATYNKKKSLVALDTLINDKTVDENGNLVYGMSSETLNDYVDAYWQECQFSDGHVYMLPWSKSTEVMYYNKTYFDEKGLSVPDHWFSKDANDKSSMEYVCDFIKKDNVESIPLGYDSDSNWFITMCEQYGSGYTSETGNHFLFNNDTSKGFVTKFKEWADKGYVTTKSLYNAYTSGLFTSTTNYRSYMSIGSSAGANNQVPEKVNGKAPFEVGVAMIPQMDSANPKVISQGPDVCIFRNKDPQKVIASYLFLKFFSTYQIFQCQFSMSSGYMPVIKSAADNATYAKFLNGTSVAAMSVKQSQDQSKAYFVSPSFVGSATCRKSVGEIISAVLAGSKSVDKAFDDAINELEYIS